MLDLQLKQGTGLGVLKALGAGKPEGAKVIVLTNYAIPAVPRPQRGAGR